MALLSKKINNIYSDGIGLLATLYYIENFKFCNKYKVFLIRDISFMIKKVFKKNLAS